MYLIGADSEWFVTKNNLCPQTQRWLIFFQEVRGFGRVPVDLSLDKQMNEFCLQTLSLNHFDAFDICRQWMICN